MPHERSALFLLMLAAITASLALSACGGLQSDAAASVNGTIITKQDVENRINLLRKTYGAMIPADDTGDRIENFRKETADQLVREELEKQETAKKNITVSTAEIDIRFQELADENYLGDVDRLKQDYASKGFTAEEMNDEVRRALLHEKLMESIGREINVTDDDARAYYDRNISQYDLPERRQVRQIVTDDESAAADATRRARGGESFVSLVDQLSKDPEAGEKKGAIGLVTQGQLPPELEQEIWKMQIGEVSAPVKSGQYWYVLTLENILSPVKQQYEDIKDEIKTIYGNQIFSDKWRQYVNDVYDAATVEFAPDYDPANKVEQSSSTP